MSEATLPDAAPRREFSTRYRVYVLGVLMGVNLFNFMDRSILGVLIEPIKHELQASDTEMGILTGLAFAVFYATCGFPIARLADRGLRVRVIGWAMAIWSLMTVASGLATAYWQMLLARVGVGIGEAGGSPPSQALLADYFPIEQRARAIAFFVAGAHIGIFLGTLLAGYIGHEYGWRMAFIVLGAPGVVFAIVVRFTVREAPPRGKVEAAASPLRSGSLWQATMHLFRGPAFRHLMIATGILWFSTVGAGQWHAPFLQRSHGMALNEVGLLLSLLSIPQLVAVMVGGFAADRLARRNPAWQVYVPLLGTLISVPFLLGFYLLADWRWAFASAVVAMLAAGVFAGVLLAAVQGLVGPHARALAGAILMFSSNLIGVGLGPFAVGALSDVLAPWLGQDSLRWALVLMKALPLLAVYHMWIASRYFNEELREEPPTGRSAPKREGPAPRTEGQRGRRAPRDSGGPP